MAGMTDPRDEYCVPLTSRYATAAMCRLFSDNAKYSCWRRLWLLLAKAEKDLGIPGISDEAIAEIRHALSFPVDYAAVSAYEARLRHDVMAHLHAFGDICPTAKPILHLGATSCYITDNADLMAYRDAVNFLIDSLASLLRRMCAFAKKHRALPTLGSTHFQPAQPTTVGKRCALWIQDLTMDLRNLVRARDDLQFRGVKGTTGTQASFLALFNGDHARVEALDALVAQRAGFQASYLVTGQTYPRKVDYDLLAAVASLGVSAHRVATDLRLLSGLQEIAEPFEPDQVGSSAMAYKRNPMRCERICSIARYLMTLPANPAATASIQWLERTLDDSANRRIVMPSAFLAADSILLILRNVFDGLVVFPAVIAARLRAELPFMATERVIMEMVNLHAADRNECHEHIRRLSLEARKEILENGAPNDLIDRLRRCNYFEPIKSKLDTIMNDSAAFIGRAPEQVDAFLEHIEATVLKPYDEHANRADSTAAPIRV